MGRVPARSSWDGEKEKEGLEEVEEEEEGMEEEEQVEETEDSELFLVASFGGG